MKSISFTLISVVLGLASSAAAQIVSSSNVLVSEGDELFEYTRTGSLVQSFGIVPHPDTGRYDITDVVADRSGRIYVLNSAPFDNDYLSTLSPAGVWQHTPDPAGGFGNVSDADLSIRENVVVSNRTRFDLQGLSVTQFIVPGFRGVGEVSFGLDGLIYALDSGSPRPGVRVLDPDTFSLIRTFELRDQTGSRLDARGIAVDSEGIMFVADWDGMIYKFDESGDFLESASTGARNLLDIDLHSDGTLIAGSRFGDVVVTNTSLESITRFSVGSGLTYVGFAEVPEPTTFFSMIIGFAMFSLRQRRTKR